MKKTLKISLLCLLLGGGAFFVKAEESIIVSFCNKGTGGTCTVRGDGNGFNCDANQDGQTGGDCSGSHLQTIS